MLFNKIAITGAALALTVATIGAGAAFAAAPVAGTGSTGSCLFTGKAAIKPAIVIGGTLPGGPTKVSGKLGTKTTPCSGGTGNGATLASGTAAGVIPAAATNDCLALGDRRSERVQHHGEVEDRQGCGQAAPDDDCRRRDRPRRHQPGGPERLDPDHVERYRRSDRRQGQAAVVRR